MAYTTTNLQGDADRICARMQARMRGHRGETHGPSVSERKVLAVAQNQKPEQSRNATI